MTREQISKLSWILIIFGGVLVVGNIIFYARNVESLPRLNESLQAWIYLAPAIIGGLFAATGLILDEYLKTGEFKKAVIGALASLSIVFFIILFRILFG